jgi:HPt (histidine-containing phosphotransfer) domain-containing protein
MNQENRLKLPIDLEAAKSRAMDDTEFLLELLFAFVESVPGIFDSLHRSLADRDGQTLSRTAHQLKGTALNLGLVGIAEKASVLNELGRREDCRNTSDALAALKRSVEEFEVFLQNDLHPALGPPGDEHENTCSR